MTTSSLLEQRSDQPGEKSEDAFFIQKIENFDFTHSDSDVANAVNQLCLKFPQQAIIVIPQVIDRAIELLKDNSHQELARWFFKIVAKSSERGKDCGLFPTLMKIANVGNLCKLDSSHLYAVTRAIPACVEDGNDNCILAAVALETLAQRLRSTHLTDLIKVINKTSSLLRQKGYVK